MFERIRTQLPEIVVLEPRIHHDSRGFFAEVYRANEFSMLGVREEFVQENHSRSGKGTLRGLHYQLRHPQAKLCRVIRGAVFDVAVDIRQGSPTFGRFASATLTAENMRSIYIPAGFAHGFVVLSDDAEFLYKCSDYYDPGAEHGVLWSDPALGIEWNVTDPILSDKDRGYPRLADIPKNLLPNFENS